MTTQNWKACWPAGQDSLIVADVAAQDDRILLAVHQPPVIKRMPVALPGRRHESVGQASEASQDDLLHDLIEVHPREGTLVLPIIGVPGTGKSHLIRWLNAAIPPERSDLIVRHVPREGTSLPDVVRLLLEGLTGGRFDELRQSMETARSNIGSLDQAANRLSLRIAELIQFGVPGGWRRAALVDEATRDGLCESSILPALLTDHVCRAHLTRPGGPIHRLARDIVEGYRPPIGDEEDELGFHEDDLLFQSANLRGASQYARRAVAHLKMPGVAAAASRILSDALDVASSDVIGLSTVSLADVLLDLRSTLLREGKELVLLFEDVAIARGLQLDLVDALTTPAVRGGKKQLCTLRAALAITPTYWDEQAPETLATRISAWGGSMFSLDVPTAESDELAVQLVGRYMNAARIGVDHLRTLEPRVLSEGTPNACDACPFDRRDECHATFGATDSGHGLFPLTTRAVRTLTGLATDSTFRPRAVLNGVVAPVLVERSALDRGGFPRVGDAIQSLISAGVERRDIADVSLDVVDAMDAAALAGDERERAQAIIRAWGDGQGAPGRSVLSALGLPESLADVADGRALTPRSPRGPAAGDPPNQPKTPVRSRQVDRQITLLEAWAAGSTDLRAEVVRPLRKMLFDELRAGIRWEEFGLGRELAFQSLGIRGSDQQQPNLAILIDRSAGGGATRSTEPILHLEPSGPNARLLTGLLLRQHHGSWSFAGGSDALARVRSVVRRAESTVIERLQTGGFSVRRITEATQVLTLATVALNDSEGDARWDGPLSSLFEPANEPPVDNRSAAWQEFVRVSLSDRKEVIDIVKAAATRRQGIGAAATVVDSTLFDDRRIANDPIAMKRPPKDSELLERHTRLVRLAKAALAEEQDAIRPLVEAVEDQIGVGSSLALKTIQDAVGAAVARASKAHVLSPWDAKDRLRGLSRSLPVSTVATEVLEDTRRALRASEKGLSVDALARLAALDVSSLTSIAAYLRFTADVIADSIQTATTVISAEARTDSESAAPARTALASLKVLAREFV